MDSVGIKDGFEGQKLITLPDGVIKDYLRQTPVVNQLYITHIGYFPNAKSHYITRDEGCPDNILIYCVRGNGHFQIGKKKFEMHPNQFIITPATTQPLTYGTSEEDPWTIYWLHFTGRDIDKFNKLFDIQISSVPQDIPHNKKGLEVWDEMYKSLEMGFSLENIRHANLCLSYFLSTFFYPEKSKVENGGDDDFVTTTILYMRSKLNERLSVEDMAALHHLSVSHFSAMFRKATGMPPIDYFIHLKIQQACQLLYSGKAKVKEVAESLGYEDAFYFSRLFKKYMKISPEKYKSMNQKTDIG